MSGTKKVGATGRYGVRYGRTIRERVLAAAAKPQLCPACRKPALRRQAAGIWSCKRCSRTFAGKAYKPF